MPKVPDSYHTFRLEVEVVEEDLIKQIKHEPGTYFSFGYKVEQEWRRGKHLGGGSYGQVWEEVCTKGSDKGAVRAVKQLKRAGAVDFKKELDAAKLFSEPVYERSFVKSFGWYDKPEHICLTMEYMPHGDLRKHMPGLSERDTRVIVRQILQGLDCMHTHDFIHRDLKPANILVRKPGPQWWIKIADFGISKRVEEAMEGQDTEGMGTPYFASPEQQFRGALCCTHTSDIWSTGIIAFNLLTGEVPFSDTDRAMPLLRRYWNGKSKLPYQMLRARKTSNDGLQFIGLLLAADPEKRPAAQDCLNHSWVGPNLDADSELSEVAKAKAEEPEDRKTEPAQTQGFFMTLGSWLWPSIAANTPSHPPGSEPLESEMGDEYEEWTGPIQARPSHATSQPSAQEGLIPVIDVPVPTVTTPAYGYGPGRWSQIDEPLSIVTSEMMAHASDRREFRDNSYHSYGSASHNSSFDRRTSETHARQGSNGQSFMDSGYQSSSSDPRATSSSGRRVSEGATKDRSRQKHNAKYQSATTDWSCTSPYASHASAAHTFASFHDQETAAESPMTQSAPPLPQRPANSEWYQGYEITGHKGHVTAVAMSDDGRYGASSSHEGTLKVWEPNKPQSWTCEVKDVTELRFSAGAETLAVRTERALKLFRGWPFKSYARIDVDGPYSEVNPFVGDIRFSRDGERIAVICTPRTLFESAGIWQSAGIWVVDVNKGEVTRKIKSDGSLITSFAMTPDLNWLAAGLASNKVMRWDLQEYRQTNILAHDACASHRVSRVAFTGNGMLAAVSSHPEHGLLKVWGRANGEPIEHRNHGHSLLECASRPNSGIIAIGDSSGAVSLFDPVTGTSSRLPFQHDGPVLRIVFSPDGRYGVSCGYKKLILWDAESGETLFGFVEHIAWRGFRAVFSADSKTLAVSLRDKVQFLRCSVNR